MTDDTITCNAAISACEKGEQWQQALELFERMWCESVKRDTITYNSAISAYEKSGQWQQALELFERMWCESVKRALENICSADCFLFL